MTGPEEAEAALRSLLHSGWWPPPPAGERRYSDESREEYLERCHQVALNTVRHALIAAMDASTTRGAAEIVRANEVAEALADDLSIEEAHCAAAGHLPGRWRLAGNPRVEFRVCGCGRNLQNRRIEDRTWV